MVPEQGIGTTGLDTNPVYYSGRDTKQYTDTTTKIVYNLSVTRLTFNSGILCHQKFIVVYSTTKNYGSALSK